MSDDLRTHPRIVALVPARGGSKRLPGKNIRSFAGRPLLAWTVAAAAGAPRVGRIVVSTDDDEIASVAAEAGAEVPFRRDPELASDTATSDDVVLDALRRLRAAGDNSTHVMLLQPTSPLRTSADIEAAIDVLVERRADAVISVSPAECPPAWINIVPDDGSMTSFFRDGVRGVRSQDHRPTYRLNGAVEIYAIDRALAQNSLEMDDATYAYVMPRERAVDIDDEIDFAVAEALQRVAVEPTEED